MWRRNEGFVGGPRVFYNITFAYCVFLPFLSVHMLWSIMHRQPPHPHSSAQPVTTYSEEYHEDEWETETSTFMFLSASEVSYLLHDFKHPLVGRRHNLFINPHRTVVRQLLCVGACLCLHLVLACVCVQTLDWIRWTRTACSIPLEITRKHWKWNNVSQKRSSHPQK